MTDEEDDRYPDDRPRGRPDDDWDADGPRRHHYGDDRDDYDEEYGYSDQQQRVRGPAVALIIVGVLGVLGSLAMGGVFAFILTEQAKRAPGAGADDAITAGIFIALSGLSLVASLIVAIGGARMRQCRNWGLAMTAAILTIASFVLLGLCSVFVVPFGIWAVVVLSNSDVKREFRRVALRGHPAAQDEWDE